MRTQRAKKNGRDKSWLLGLFLAIALCPSAQAQEREGDAPVYVLLWFDTEDYLLPASDDAALRLANFLTREGVRATFKLVGEKARVLEKRRRQDVIAALQRHEIGYHTDFHSVKPTPAEFLSVQDWEGGVLEFDRRQRRGFLDVEHITGQKPTCYGQPGSSWGPQQFEAIRKWGISVYLDAGRHVSLNGGPFWYGGVLNLYALKDTLRTGLGGEQDFAEARQEFDRAYQMLLSEGGGPISIYYHPCEFVHSRFWDAVNFSGGANPPRSEWKIPPVKSEEEIRVAHETFERYIRYIKSQPRIEFITASQALGLYSDRARGGRFSISEVRSLAEGVGAIITYQQKGDLVVSAGEQLTILNRFAAQALSGTTPEVTPLAAAPDGPTRGAPRHGTVTVGRSQFERAVHDVEEQLTRHQRVPSAVWLGSVPVSPESYLRSLAGAAILLSERKPLPREVVFRPADLGAADHVQEDSPKLWGWVIFPTGFSAPEMMQLAKRQAWTLKPALLTGSH